MQKMNVEELFVRLRIEEGNCGLKKKSEKNPMEAKANAVEQGSKPNKRKRRGEVSSKEKKKFKGKCYNCDRPGHRPGECRRLKNFKKKMHMLV